MKNKTAKAEFDQFAHSYMEQLDDPVRRLFTDNAIFFHRRKMDLLLSLLQKRRMNPAAMHWLDVGCGRGDLLKLGKGTFGSLGGCDLSAEMLAYCDGLNVRRQNSVSALPFESGSADLITAVCLLHHVELEDRRPLMQEMARILKPGGLLVVIEHNTYNPVTQWIVKRSPVDENARLLSPRLSSRLMQAVGIPASQTEYFLYFPEKLYLAIGGIERYLSRVPFGGQYMMVGAKPVQGLP